jgi:hypothetical protein
MYLLLIVGWLALAPIPVAVKTAFAKLYPTATQVKFVQENKDYEAAFQVNGKSMSVVMDVAGTVKATETTIRQADLPAAVRAYVAKNKPGQKINEAAEIVDANGVKTYEAEVGGKDLIFDASGKLVN